MRIFVSWSGERSKSIALGLKSLLQDLFLDSIEVFVSDHISPGEAWASRLGTELEQSNFGILCLTLENFEAPWLLFEAGAIAKQFQSSRVARVVPYLIDELPPASERSPLAQFQHVRADREGTYRLVECINNLRENQRSMERAFDKWWPDLGQTLARLPAPDADQSVMKSEKQLLEQILHRVEGLWHAHRESKILPKPELAHLLNLRDQGTTIYTRDDNLKHELRHLRDLGFIKNRKPIADLPANFQLNQHFDLTDKGKTYLQELDQA